MRSVPFLPKPGRSVPECNLCQLRSLCSCPDIVRVHLLGGLERQVTAAFFKIVADSETVEMETLDS